MSCIQMTENGLPYLLPMNKKWKQGDLISILS